MNFRELIAAFMEVLSLDVLPAANPASVARAPAHSVVALAGFLTAFGAAALFTEDTWRTLLLVAALLAMVWGIVARLAYQNAPLSTVVASHVNLVFFWTMVAAVCLAALSLIFPPHERWNRLIVSSFAGCLLVLMAVVRSHLPLGKRLIYGMGISLTIVIELALTILR